MATQILTDADRLLKVLEYKKISRNNLSKSIKDKSGTKLYHISKGRNKFSEKLAADITNYYLDINYTWLLTGKGEMLKESRLSKVKEPTAEYKTMRTPEEIRKIFKNKTISGYRLEKDLNVTQVGADKFLNGETKKPYKSTLKLYNDYINNGFKPAKNNNSYTKELKVKEPVAEYKSTFITKEVTYNEVTAIPENDYMVVEYEDLETVAGKLGHSGDVSAIPDKKKRLIPKEYKKGIYLVVKVNGHSMDDGTKRSICDGEELLIKELDDFIVENLPIRNKLFVIVTSDGSAIKQIRTVDKDRREITCRSFNSDWEDYEVGFDDILQLFTVEKVVNRKVKF